MNKMQTALVKEIKKVSSRVDEVWQKIMYNNENKDQQKESVIELDNDDAGDKQQQENEENEIQEDDENR